MLTYVALQVLSYLIGGPWKDPNGRNFPQTAPLADGQVLPVYEIAGVPFHFGVVVALILPFLFWFLMSRSVLGFQIRVVGSAPHAARHGGFSQRQTVWLSMLIGGGAAGLAGVLELTGSLKAINLGFPSGYGFTAIIVAFLGRLHPIGILLAGGLMALTYIGGEIAQGNLGLPAAAIQVFQGMLLFFLLAFDLLTNYRIRLKTREAA